MEITSNAVQEVAAGSNVLMTNTVIPGGCSIVHRSGSGLVTLRGLTNNQCRARFRVTFGANIALPTGGTVGAISLALAINGEGVATTTMITTPLMNTTMFLVAFSQMFQKVAALKLA